MNIDSFIKSKSGCISKDTKDGMLILSPDEKYLYILKGCAVDVWTRSSGKKTLKQIIEEISQEFAMDFNKARKDILDFLKDALQENPPLFVLSKNPVQ